jgi:hypothetical protein
MRNPDDFRRRLYLLPFVRDSRSQRSSEQNWTLARTIPLHADGFFVPWQHLNADSLLQTAASIRTTIEDRNSLHPFIDSCRFVPALTRDTRAA